MTTLQLIEMLCQLVEQLISIVHRLATALEQSKCLSDADRAAIAQATQSYNAIIGAEDVPEQNAES